MLVGKLQLSRDIAKKCLRCAVNANMCCDFWIFCSSLSVRLVVCRNTVSDGIRPDGNHSIDEDVGLHCSNIPCTD